MKIAIPVDEKSLNSAVSQSFGRAPYFFFYDTETEESDFLDNGAVASQGGAGIKAAQAIVDNGAKALLAPRCGGNAEEVLRRSEVVIYQSLPGTIKENLDAFAAQRLVLLSDFHPGLHGHEK